MALTNLRFCMPASLSILRWSLAVKPTGPVHSCEIGFLCLEPFGFSPMQPLQKIYGTKNSESPIVQGYWRCIVSPILLLLDNKMSSSQVHLAPH